MKKQLEMRKGFTIIEVVLVLAIAGLIFLMVFIALPALQRSQRDTQRNQDVSRLSTAINNFKTNNRGNIPGKTKAGDGQDATVQGHAEKLATSPKTGTWGYFYDNYLLVGSAGQTDTFADPDGSSYGLYVTTCTKNSGSTSTTGAEVCTEQRNTATFDAQSDGTADNSSTGNGSTWAASASDASATDGHSILVLYQASCDGEDAVYSSGKRNLALLYKREGGGTICIAV